MAAVLVGLTGGAIELWRFGASDAATAGRIRAQVERDFAAMTSALGRVAETVASSAEAPDALQGGPATARPLFDLLAAARARDAGTRELAVTVYDTAGVARAWAGRPADIPNERIPAAPGYFVTQSPLGLRLVHIRPVADASGRRLGAVAVEHILSPATTAATITEISYTLATPIAPVSLRLRYEGAGERAGETTFVLRAPDGDPLVEASINPGDMHRARRTWRVLVYGAILAVGAVVLLLLTGPLLDRRAAARDARAFLRPTLAASGLVIASGLTFWLAFTVAASDVPARPAVLMLFGIGAAALVALWAGAAVRRRLGFRSGRHLPTERPIRFVVTQLAAGVAAAALLIAVERAFGAIVDGSTIDVRRFSLHPWNGTRVALVGAIFALQLAALWAATSILAAAPAPWRLRQRSGSARLALISLWIAPTVVAAGIGAARQTLPATGILIDVLACAIAAAFAPRLVTWYRQTTVVTRILALFVAFLVPSLVLYQSINFFAERYTRRLIEQQYAVEAQNHAQHLQKSMESAMYEIDGIATLSDLVTAPTEGPHEGTRTEGAFLVWGRTSLARERLTSAIELYDGTGDLVSRFGLNFPEYVGSTPKPPPATSCTWDLFGEAQPFGSEERNMLHAERGICEVQIDGRLGPPVGMVVVHVMFDYRSLPFISSQSPYFELFRPTESRAPSEGAPGGDVDVAIYGWGLHPLYTSGRSAWSITGPLFDRIYDASRQPFWTRIKSGSDTDEVYFSNDRSFIYAVGYPSLTLFDHLVQLAELTTLSGVAFVIALLGTALFTRISRERARVGRALLREIRASFYRKLFLAFVLASVVPVLTLALVIRTYFADLLRDAVQSEAARTAAVAQRVIQQSEATWRRSANGIEPGSDDVMVTISQIIDQDVNIFDGATLIATSERDLFSSGLLPTRTPDDVYRAIMLDKLPSFVDEDAIGTFPYMIAAAPVRVGDRDRILTVPLANRQREIEREIDDLDRGVHLASLFFILLGAAIGLSLAERIADPVRRLTRATRRIATGDFDARIAVRSSDELRRLVDAFNSMAAELKAQRGQLERTHRLEAWAEMARQVAHEIKNPLTPIQLSAEHLRRVHADRGEPMGAVLDSCVTTILGQVRLLRQISAEFSNFASSPTARPGPVDLPALVADVVNPYREGLADRITIENHVAGPLPRVFVDRTLAARALANIVENALHAMPGEGSLTITAYAAGADTVTLEVRDTGIGMDADALARVFEPYFSTKTTGTGLGLPIARRNIELNGGAIEVESAKGVGTTVRVKLPVAVA